MKTSLKLDGKGQYLARIEDINSFLDVYNKGNYNDGVYNGLSNLSIANIWTLAFWAKPRSYKEHATIFSMGEKDDKNEIRISVTPVSAEREIFGKNFSEMRVLIKDANGTTIKHYSWPDWFQTEEWLHTTLEWNGTDLEAFRAGLPTTTGITFVNASGIMSDSARGIFYGSAIVGDFATFSGTLGHFGMWNALLDPGELGTVVSGGFSTDLTITSGTYVSQGTLQHYWKPGDDPANIGKDFVASGIAVDLTKEHDIDSNNIIIDEPI